MFSLQLIIAWVAFLHPILRSVASNPESFNSNQKAADETFTEFPPSLTHHTIPTLNGGLEFDLCYFGAICGYSASELVSSTSNSTQCAIDCSNYVLNGELTQYFYHDLYGCYCALNANDCQVAIGATSYALNGQPCGAAPNTTMVTLCLSDQECPFTNDHYEGKFATAEECGATCIQLDSGNSKYINYVASGPYNYQSCYCLSTENVELSSCQSSTGTNVYEINGNCSAFSTSSPSLAITGAPTIASSVTPSLAPSLSPSTAKTAVPSVMPSLTSTAFPSVTITTPPTTVSTAIPTLSTLAPSTVTPSTLAPTTSTTVTLCESNLVCSMSDGYIAGTLATTEECAAACFAHGEGDGQYFNYAVSGSIGLHACYCLTTATLYLSTCQSYAGVNLYAIDGNCSLSYYSASPSVAPTAAPTTVAPSSSITTTTPSLSPSSASPTVPPSSSFSVAPSVAPSLIPSLSPTTTRTTIPTLSGGLEVELCWNNTICGSDAATRIIFQNNDLTECATQCASYELNGKYAQYFYLDTWGCYCTSDATNCQPSEGTASYALNGQPCGAAPTTTTTVTLCASNLHCSTENGFIGGNFATAQECGETCLAFGEGDGLYISYIIGGPENGACYCLSTAQVYLSTCEVSNRTNLYAINSNCSLSYYSASPSVAITAAPTTVAPSLSPSSVAPSLTSTVAPSTLAPTTTTTFTLCESNLVCSMSDGYLAGTLATTEECAAACFAHGEGDGQYFNYAVSGSIGLHACYCLTTATLYLSTCQSYAGINLYAIDGNCSLSYYSASPSVAPTAAPSTVYTTFPTFSTDFEVERCWNNTICGFDAAVRIIYETTDVTECATQCANYQLNGNYAQYFYLDTWGCYCTSDATNCQPSEGTTSYALNGQPCGAAPTTTTTVTLCASNLLCSPNDGIYAGVLATVEDCAEACLAYGEGYDVYINYQLSGQGNVHGCSCPATAYVLLSTCEAFTGMNLYAINGNCSLSYYSASPSIAITAAPSTIAPSHSPLSPPSVSGTPSLSTIAPTTAVPTNFVTSSAIPTVVPTITTTFTLCESNLVCSMSDGYIAGTLATTEECAAACFAHGEGDGQYFNYAVSGSIGLHTCYCLTTATLYLSTCQSYAGVNLYAIDGNCSLSYYSASPSVAPTAASTTVAPSSSITTTTPSLSPSSASPTVPPSSSFSVAPSVAPSLIPSLSPTTTRTTIPTLSGGLEVELCWNNTICGSDAATRIIFQNNDLTECATQCASYELNGKYAQYFYLDTWGCYCTSDATNCQPSEGTASYALNGQSCGAAPTTTTTVTLCASNLHCSTENGFIGGNFATAQECGETCLAFGEGDGLYISYIIGGPENGACYCLSTAQVYLSTCEVSNRTNLYAINSNCSLSYYSASPSVAITAAPTTVAPSLSPSSVAPSLTSTVAPSTLAPTTTTTFTLCESNLVCSMSDGYLAGTLATPEECAAACFAHGEGDGQYFNYAVSGSIGLHACYCLTTATLYLSTCQSYAGINLYAIDGNCSLSYYSASPSVAPTAAPSTVYTTFPTFSTDFEVERCWNNTICGFDAATQVIYETTDVTECATQCANYQLNGKYAQYFYLDRWGCYCTSDATNCQPSEGTTSYALNGQPCGAAPTTTTTVTLCASNLLCSPNDGIYAGVLATVEDCAEACLAYGEGYDVYINYQLSGQGTVHGCSCPATAYVLLSTCEAFTGMNLYAINGNCSLSYYSASPSIAITAAPSTAITAAPSTAITAAPSTAITAAPSTAITAAPSTSITAAPSTAITAAPSTSITAAPSTIAPSIPITTMVPSLTPTVTLTASPTVPPSAFPSVFPTARPTVVQSPTAAPSALPSATPTVALNTTLCLAETHCQIFFSPEGSFPTPASCALGCSTQYSYPWNQYFNFGSSISCQCISSATSCTTGVTGSGVYAIVSNGAVCPAPASSPTLAPTIQVTPSIIAEAKTLLNFNGITDASQLTSTDIATIQAAIATVLGVSVTNVEILSVVDAALSSRRGRRQLKGSATANERLSVQSSGLNVDVNSQIIYNLVDYPNYNATTLKKQIAEAITNTSSNGALQNAIVALARANNLTVLMEVQVLESQVTGITTKTPSSSSSSSSNNNGLSSGEIAVVVIVPIVGLVIIIFLLYQWIRVSRLTKVTNVPAAGGSTVNPLLVTLTMGEEEKVAFNPSHPQTQLITTMLLN